MLAKMLFRLMTELSSRKTISRMTGALAKSNISRALIPWFAKTYGIRLEDAEKHASDYRSLNEFFTRRLKAGLRPIHPHEASLVSPVDAVITGIGPISPNHRFEVKGQTYTLEEILNGASRQIHYKNGFFLVLYLSPTDYHRIHSPVTGRIVEREHVPGKVYPVNEFGLRHMKRVLSRNERLISYIEHAFGEVAVIKVGAMNVSSIRYVEPLQDQLEKGQDLAYFEFGSTVVLLIESETFECRSDLQVGSQVKMGESLGVLHGKKA